LENTFERQAIVFPNPAKNHLIIDNSKFTYHDYLIFDLNGRVVKNDKLAKENEIKDISDLPPGTYVISLYGITGSYSIQVVKAR
jgi:hypothetical protein